MHKVTPFAFARQVIPAVLCYFLVLVSFVMCNMQKVRTVEDLMSIVEEYHPGQTVRVRIFPTQYPL